MSKQESFAKVKLETAESIRAELKKANHPVSMYKQAIKILARMERNFDRALGNDLNDNFDGKVIDTVLGNRFEGKARQLRKKSMELIKKMGVGTALWQLARKKLGKSYVRKGEVEKLTQELLGIQAMAKIEVEVDLFQDSKLNWNSHKKFINNIQKNLKQFTPAQLLEQNPDPDIVKFINDPALNRIFDIDILRVNSSERQYRELKLMVARNLFIKGKKVNSKNIKAEYSEVVKFRERYKNISVFANRNVLIVTDNQTVEEYIDGKMQEIYNDELKLLQQRGVGEGSDEMKYLENAQKELAQIAIELKERFRKRYKRGPLDNVFMTKLAYNAVKRQNCKTVEKIVSKNDKESLIKTKEQIKLKIINSPPPFTYMFTGHGNLNVLSLSSSQKINFTVEELADCIVARYDKFPGLRQANPEMQDIFIFLSCYSHNFLRNLYKQIKFKVKHKNFKLPVMFSSSEFGQKSTSSLFDQFGSNILKYVMNLPSGRRATLGTIMDREYLNSSNPSLFIPTQEKRMMQISSKDVDKSDRKTV